jgi:hypothetical protein
MELTNFFGEKGGICLFFLIVRNKFIFLFWFMFIIKSSTNQSIKDQQWSKRNKDRKLKMNSHRYITWFKWLKISSPANPSIGFLFCYGFIKLPSHFLVLVGKIKCSFWKKLRMELKCRRYDVTDGDVYSIFYLTKTMSDTETDSP